jgi:hypothetical protein
VQPNATRARSALLIPTLSLKKDLLGNFHFKARSLVTLEEKDNIDSSGKVDAGVRPVSILPLSRKMAVRLVLIIRKRVWQPIYASGRDCTASMF